MWHICTADYYSVIRKDEICPFVTSWMQLDGVMQRKFHKEKTKYQNMSVIQRIQRSTARKQTKPNENQPLDSSIRTEVTRGEQKKGTEREK